MTDKLRVYARGEGSVPHYGSAIPVHGGAPQRRISHAHEPEAGARYIDADGNERRHGAWIKRVGEPLDVPASGEYIRHLRDGDLFPADQATAQVIGFPFYLKGEQLEKELARGSVPHRWREIAVAAVKAKTSFYDEMVAERDEEHGDSAVAEHEKAVADLRATVPSEPPAKPKAVIV